MNNKEISYNIEKIAEALILIADAHPKIKSTLYDLVSDIDQDVYLKAVGDVYYRS